MAQHRPRILDVLDRLEEDDSVARGGEGLDHAALEPEVRPRVAQAGVVVGLGVGIHADHLRRPAGQYGRPVSLPAGHVDHPHPGDPVGDPFVDGEMAPVPVVLGRDVGQGALSGEGQRRDARRLVALEVGLGAHGPASLGPAATATSTGAPTA